MKGSLTFNGKHRLWCMIHGNQFYFADNEQDPEPRLFFCFDGCLVNVKGRHLEIQTAELVGSNVPRGQYKFVADTEESALEWYEASLRASSHRN
mmetsp:Transcript_26834/g.61832  ORF Transcript_26834/g.61832 Transcript_26834/m.61832 type:complete len:94 (+) Transcript_26834:65-346(+)